MSINWNPWHGCHKISEGCRHCYVYRQDHKFDKDSSIVQLTNNYTLPIKRKRDGSYKVAAGQLVYTCFTSDFFVEEADHWRTKAWEMIHQRSDLNFFIITKRIDRFEKCQPDDWNDGYDNVIIGCTVENQEMADYRLPIFEQTAIKHKIIICGPIIGPIDVSKYLNSSIEQLSASGESGNEARICDYNWALALRQQCIANDTPFLFHQTGARLLKDNRLYQIERKFQHQQAHKAKIDFKTDWRNMY